eukprot:3393694-Rhodomonas_salina.1
MKCTPELREKGEGGRVVERREGVCNGGGRPRKGGTSLHVHPRPEALHYRAERRSIGTPYLFAVPCACSTIPHRSTVPVHRSVLLCYTFTRTAVPQYRESVAAYPSSVP